MMKRLKILFYSYQHIGFNTGGLQEQIFNTKLALEKEGHIVYLLDEWLNENKPKVDICHQFSVHFTLTNTFREIKSLGLPIVISTVYNEESSVLKSLTRKISSIGIPLLYYNNIRYFLNNSNFLITLGKSETKSLLNRFNTKTPIQEISNGISSEIIEFHATDKDQTNINNVVSVVSVGTICKNKNQLSLIKACKKLGVKLILIGPESKSDSEYVKLCKSHEKENIVFKGYLNNKSHEFLEIISEASVFALVSHKEVLPISVFEALALEKPVTCTINSSVSDYFAKNDNVDYCKPHSDADIYRSLKKQLSVKFNPILSTYIKQEFTWSKVAEKIENVYFKVLEK